LSLCCPFVLLQAAAAAPSVGTDSRKAAAQAADAAQAAEILQKMITSQQAGSHTPAGTNSGSKAGQQQGGRAAGPAGRGKQQQQQQENLHPKAEGLHSSSSSSSNSSSSRLSSVDDQLAQSIKAATQAAVAGQLAVAQREYQEASGQVTSKHVMCILGSDCMCLESSTANFTM
jgi:hypothetical protein